MPTDLPPPSINDKRSYNETRTLIMLRKVLTGYTPEEIEVIAECLTLNYYENIGDWNIAFWGIDNEKYKNINKFCLAALLSSVDQDDYGYVELDHDNNEKIKDPKNISNKLNLNKEGGEEALSLQEIRKWQHEHDKAYLPRGEGTYYSEKNPPQVFKVEIEGKTTIPYEYCNLAIREIKKDIAKYTAPH
jgi:hypothetical protein